MPMGSKEFTVVSAVLCAAARAAAGADAADWPFITIRQTGLFAGQEETLRQIAECHKRHPGACDEFWFATGARKPIPDVVKECEAFALCRDLCAEAGILPGYQQGLTLGHGERARDSLAGPGEHEFPLDAYQRRADGSFLGFLCPRSPDVLAYAHDYARTVLEVAGPASYWIDDDLRLGVAHADGCFCDRCIAAFNARTGGNWTREELVRRLYDRTVVQEPLREQWSAFNAESLALYAAEVRRAADELGSPCRLGYQSVSANRLYPAPHYGPLLAALSGPAGAPVGIRPGDGCYDESDPRVMVRKCLGVAREAERLRGVSVPVASICYEEETYPRHMLHKSPGAIMTECALALASGCNTLSLYWFPAESPMPVAEYDRFLDTLSAARPYFERLAASTRRTRLGGVARFVGSAARQLPDFHLEDGTDFDLACAGIPVTVAESGTRVFYLTDKSRAEMTEADKALLATAGASSPASGASGAAEAPSPAVVDVSRMGKFPTVARRARLLDDLDAATGGAFPVRIDECRPLRILPRVRDDGRLDSVTICNLSIGGTGPLMVRVRHPVSRNALMQDATMAAPEPAVCAAGATPDETVVTIADIPGWQIVTLFFGEEYIAPENLKPASAGDVTAEVRLNAANGGDWRWYDGATLPLEGRGYAPERLASPYHRLPADCLDRIPAAVRNLQDESAGLCLRFQTDSPKLRIAWKCTKPVKRMWNMSSSACDGVDVYQETPDGWRFVQPPFPAAAKPDGAEYTWTIRPGRTTMVYLPTYNGVAELRLGVEPGCSIEPAPPRRSGIAKPVVFYGTSITQGASASHPGGCWVARAARIADVEAVNLGFSGSGKMEDSLLDCVADIDAALYVLDTVSNMSPALVAERMERFIRRLAERRPGVPILLTANRFVMGDEARRRDAAVRAVYDKLKAEDSRAWDNLHFAGDDADALAPDDDGSVDGIHINDLGMKRAGDYFGAVIRDILR